MDRPQLEYALRPPLYQRRRVRRWLISAVAILIVGPFSWIAAPRAWTRARLLYWQHRAMWYSPPSDQVVYDDDPRHCQELLKSREFDEVSGSLNNHTAIRLAVPWDEFCTLTMPPGALAKATLFLHERRNSKRESRLVAIAGGWPQWVYDGPPARSEPENFVLMATVVRPASLNSSPAGMGPLIINLDAGSYRETDRLEWFAGQPDPTDDSHFTIRFELNGKPGIVDGWLKDDDTVAIETRK